MRHSLKFYALLLLELIVLSSAKDVCQLPQRYTPNANTASDLPIDIVTDPKHDLGFNQADFVPYFCATVAKKTTAIKKQCITHKKQFVFNKIPELTTLLSARKNDIIPRTKRIFAIAIDELLKNNYFSLPREEAMHTLKKVLRYREHIENAQFAKKLTHINCGEHQSIAFLETLLQFHNNCMPTGTPQIIHTITLSASRKSVDNHAFLIFGSHTLRSGTVVGGKAVADILDNLDGTLVDHWNNPMHGGIRMTSKKAGNSYSLYSAKVAIFWDAIEIDTFIATDIHEQIDLLGLPASFKNFLHKHAGPTLDTLAEILSSTAKANP